MYNQLRMDLKEQINNDIKAAMKAKEKERLTALRAIKSAILLVETEKGNESGIDEGSGISLLQKLVKQRKDSATLYKEQGRDDLANDELAQANVIASYLPKQLSEEEVREIISSLIAESGASSPSDMGKVIGLSMSKMKGKAEGKLISAVVKELLND